MTSRLFFGAISLFFAVCIGILSWVIRPIDQTVLHPVYLFSSKFITVEGEIQIEGEKGTLRIWIPVPQDPRPDKYVSQKVPASLFQWVVFLVVTGFGVFFCCVVVLWLVHHKKTTKYSEKIDQMLKKLIWPIVFFVGGLAGYADLREAVYLTRMPPIAENESQRPTIVPWSIGPFDYSIGGKPRGSSATLAGLQGADLNDANNQFLDVVTEE